MWITNKAKDRAKRNPTWLLGILLALHLVAISLNRAPDTPDLWVIQQIFISITTPLQSLLTNGGVMIKGGWEHYFSLQDSRIENDELRKQLIRERTQILELKERLKNFEQFKAVIDYQSPYSYPSVEARVVGRDANELFSTIIIDKGSVNGISRNQPVVASGGLVGRVIFAAPLASRVLLITDERHASGAIISQTESNRYLGLLKGKQDYLCELKFIAPPERVKTGEAVITSGQDGIYPKGLMIGRVKVTDSDSSIVPQTVTVEPSAPLAKLEVVAVLNIPPEEIRRVEKDLPGEEQETDQASGKTGRSVRR